MPKCWCGQDHSLQSQHGEDARNGKIKHWVMNWKLYQIRKADLEERTEVLLDVKTT